MGNRTLITELAGAATLTTLYGYDPLNRLTNAIAPAIPSSPGAQLRHYTLDPTGNRLSDGTTTMAYDAADQITR